MAWVPRTFRHVFMISKAGVLAEAGAISAYEYFSRVLSGERLANFR